jgi:hypothetical protein
MLNSKYRTSFIFDVVSGYNVYSQDDLLAFDNAGGGYWNAYKEDNNLLTQPSKGLIFHNDIVIDQEFIADGFFYQQGDPEVLNTDVDYQRVIGSLRDAVHLYDRVLADGENYSINGNYFTLDYRSLPLVVREILDTNPNGRIDPEPGRVISHSYIFKVSSAVENNQGNFTMRNLRVIGNANRTEQVEKSGGALFIKFGINVDATSSNNILTQAFTFFTSELATKVVIEKTKGYDSFSSLLYNFGTADFQITDSEFIGAGGPVIINDHYAPEPDGTGGNPPGVVVTNSKLESFVSGSENWFSLVSATAAAAQIAGLGQLFPAYGNNSIIRTTTISGQDVPQFNLIGVLKAGNVNGPTSSKVRGSFTIDDGTPLDFESPLMVATSLFPTQMPRFQSSDGQFALFNGEMLVDPNNNPIPPLVMSGTNFFTGDYLNTYYNVGEGDGFMGLVFELVYPTV